MILQIKNTISQRVNKFFFSVKVLAIATALAAIIGADIQTFLNNPRLVQRFAEISILGFPLHNKYPMIRSILLPAYHFRYIHRYIFLIVRQLVNQKMIKMTPEQQYSMIFLEDSFLPSYLDDMPEQFDSDDDEEEDFDEEILQEDRGQLIQAVIYLFILHLTR